MYLQKKETYQTLTNAFNSYLNTFLDLNIKFSIRNEMLSQILFGLKPDEIHQKISRNIPVPVAWEKSKDDDRVLSIWSRLKNNFQHYDLTDQQLIDLLSNTLMPVLTELEPSIACHAFQNHLGAGYTIYAFGEHFMDYESANKTNTCLLRVKYGHHFPQESYYVPSSEKKHIWDNKRFDRETYQIIQKAYSSVLKEAQEHSIFSMNEYHEKFTDLHNISDVQHINQLIFFKEDFCKLLSDKLIEDINFLGEHLDNDLDNWWLDVDLYEHPDWFKAISESTITTGDIDEIIVDCLSKHSNLKFNKKQNFNFREFATFIIRHLTDCGELNKALELNGEHDKKENILEAIDYSFTTAHKQISSNLSQTLRLILPQGKSKQIFNLIYY